MDCRMPEMDGYECTKAIRRFEGHGKADADRRRERGRDAGPSPDVLDAGMDDFISKPIVVSELTRCLARWARRRETGEPPARIGLLQPEYVWPASSRQTPRASPK